MNLAFLLHIYQPSIQKDRIVKDVAKSSYEPLLRLIKNNPNLKLTLNIPLSLSYQLHSNGLDNLLTNIKDLYNSDKIELTSCAAFHPLLTKIPQTSVQKQIILNEYGHGYYFGKDKGFEGEDALLIKNISGFFPPEMAINMDVLKQLDDLGYSWVAVDSNAILSEDKEDGLETVYGVAEMNIKVVVRNKKLSNLISFKRDTDIDDIIDMVLDLRQEGKDAVIAMDGEYFGHHYNEGLYMLESLVDKLSALGVVLSTVGELVENSDFGAISTINESTWGANEKEVQAGNIYPLWDTPENEIQKLQWELLNKIGAISTGGNLINLSKDEVGITLETLPIWDPERLVNLKDVQAKNEIYKEILQLECMQSDQFWWASGKDVGGKEMFSAQYIEDSLDLYKKFSLISEDQDLMAFVQEHIERIQKLL